MLPRTVEKLELLQVSPETYTRALVDAAVIGLNNYASQVVQLLKPAEFATIGAMIARLLPAVRDELFQRVPAVGTIELVPRPDHVYGLADASIDGDAASLVTLAEPEIDADDPIYQAVVKLAIDDDMGGALLLGVPGTGKSWYARQIARRMTGGDPSRIREVQFHPSYQYEDFVEGYVPDGKEGFRLADKHLLEIIETARGTSGPVVLIIDEFSRTDPARVLGETMTYMEGSLRGVPFYLPSGRKISIPKNLIFLATMNPEDRSVDEIDAAMDRRWGKIRIEPNVNKVRDFITDNGTVENIRGPILQLFSDLQHHIGIGHAFFRKVRDVESLERLWESQLKYAVRKRFRLDADTLREVEALWDTCKASIEATKVAEPDPNIGNDDANQAQV